MFLSGALGFVYRLHVNHVKSCSSFSHNRSSLTINYLNNLSVLWWRSGFPEAGLGGMARSLENHLSNKGRNLWLFVCVLYFHNVEKHPIDFKCSGCAAGDPREWNVVFGKIWKRVTFRMNKLQYSASRSATTWVGYARRGGSLYYPMW